MNTVKSFWLGWGSLCVAGGGAYYFAKKEINRDRRAKLEAQRQQKDAQCALAFGTEQPSSNGNGNGNGGPARTDSTGSPSQEAGFDPASTRHAPATEMERVFEKSKYESSAPFRGPKGNRLS